MLSFSSMCEDTESTSHRCVPGLATPLVQTQWPYADSLLVHSGSRIWSRAGSLLVHSGSRVWSRALVFLNSRACGSRPASPQQMLACLMRTSSCLGHGSARLVCLVCRIALTLALLACFVSALCACHARRSSWCLMSWSAQGASSLLT